MPRVWAAATSARDTGCREPKPQLAATASSVGSEIPATGWIAITAGAPTVTVPVLSRTSVSTSDARSRKSALLMRMRRRVATVIAATMAAGPATTSAVGVATTSTAMARERFAVKNSVVAAAVSTRGSQTPARRSKRRSNGTEAPSTSASSWTTLPSTVSAPLPRTCTRRRPSSATVPANTGLPGPTSSCSDSPVMAD